MREAGIGTGCLGSLGGELGRRGRWGGVELNWEAEMGKLGVQSGSLNWGEDLGAELRV